MIPPIKPEPVSEAIMPATRPASIPGLPEMDWAINAVRTGTISPMEYPPMDLSNAAISLY
ncbi:hypothetical protein IMSAGC013_03196 [Lachnospiraceae bacterium]|nr:hypothetical protein IMSAGC013_03196 [Lachnospiraceae bacterium]